MNFCYLLVMSSAWNFAKEGGLNQGVISTLNGFYAVFNMLAFNCVSYTKPKTHQWLGVLFMVICVICLVMELKNRDNVEKI